MHEAYGGVVPELASRDHVRRVVPLIERGARPTRLAPAPTSTASPTRTGPGLAGALLVGASVASALAYALRIPAIGVHHLEGHLLSPLLADAAARLPVRRAAGVGRPQPALRRRRASARYRLLGDTLDDAAGEAFDKTAKLLGPAVSGRSGAGARWRSGERAVR